MAIHAETTRAPSPRPQYIRSWHVHSGTCHIPSVPPRRRRGQRRWAPRGPALLAYLVPPHEPSRLRELAERVRGQAKDIVRAQQLRRCVHNGFRRDQVPRPSFLRVQRQVVRLYTALPRSALIERSAVGRGDRRRGSLDAAQHARGLELLDLGWG